MVLLDDAHATQAKSRLYQDLIEEIVWNREQDWDHSWQRAQSALMQGKFAVAFLRYETGAELQQITERSTKHQAYSRILIFNDCQTLDTEQAQHFLQNLAGSSVAGVRDIHANIDQNEFRQAIQKIRDFIAAGDTYQVNFTYRLHFRSYGSAAALYLALRQRQPVPYGAFATFPNGETILSFSPELFVRHQSGTLLARPMKGTAAATGDDQIDQMNAEALSRDPKNRAENVMIVDLLRNDLGRIAETGSVTVPRLFEVNRFSSVLQMTSTVQARLKHGLDLATTMRALFPCGSITGAPKKRTMEIIREIETEERGIYTGAIGWFDTITLEDEPSGLPVPDFCLSVPIRTLELGIEENGERSGRMGVGAGIVYDSEANEEYAECQLKAKFLTGLAPRFELFETMYATREDGCRCLDLHRQRLQRSARHFGFAFDAARIENELAQHLSQLVEKTAYRLRLSLNSQGELKLQSGILSPLKQVDGAVGYIFKSEVCELDQALLNHKTTARTQYDLGWQRAEAVGGFDTIFVNAHGHITEGGRSTVFVKLNGQWWTPPLSDGVLPGILRAQILQDAQWNVRERSISVEEFLSAEQIMLGNSLRGLMPAYRLNVEGTD